MRLRLTEEQRALREAAREALGRCDPLASARAALDGAPLTDRWELAVAAGWAGMLVAEEHGGAGLHALEAMLVAAEAGRVLAPTGLLGHLPATRVLQGAGGDVAAILAGAPAGRPRMALVPARPPWPGDEDWSAEPLHGSAPLPLPELSVDGRLSGAVGWVPDAPGADLLVVCATSAEGHTCAVLVEAGAAAVEPVRGYDASRPLGHVRLDAARGERLDVPPGAVASAWFLAQALLGAEALGAAERLLEVSVAHARERFAFGRAIGSFQAVKHQLVEALRRVDNARALMTHAGEGEERGPAEWAAAASALRWVAGDALDLASRTAIAVHGGIGVTWEHDLPLYFRRAQLNRRLLGGDAGAARRVGASLLQAAADARGS